MELDKEKKKINQGYLFIMGFLVGILLMIFGNAEIFSVKYGRLPYEAFVVLFLAVVGYIVTCDKA